MGKGGKHSEKEGVKATSEVLIAGRLYDVNGFRHPGKWMNGYIEL